MQTLELRNLVDKDALMNSLSSKNDKLELTIRELSDLGGSTKYDSYQLKQHLLNKLRKVINGLS